jgi:hypothetical protein
MNIILPKYTTSYDLCPVRTEEEAKKLGLTYQSNNPGEDYIIYWGLNNHRMHAHKKFGVMETGYFNDAAFIDTVGSYQGCSLNTKFGYDAVANFDLAGRKSAKEIIFNLKAHQQSKYNANHGGALSFDQEIILACQNPTDRSIGYPNSQKKYWEFIEECCKFYGNKLFLKLHPWNTNEKATPFLDLASKYKCGAAKFAMSSICNKKFVISFNSTMAIDCVLRDVPYVQYAMGTFWNAFGVHYSNYQLPTEVEPIAGADKLADFLIHKYCYYKNMSDKNKFLNMLKHYAASDDIFPMTDEFSYANNFNT